MECYLRSLCIIFFFQYIVQLNLHQSHILLKIKNSQIPVIMFSFICLTHDIANITKHKQMIMAPQGKFKNYFKK